MSSASVTSKGRSAAPGQPPDLERLLEHIVGAMEARYPRRFAEATADFQARTGAYGPGDACYEARSQHCLDAIVCDHDDAFIARRAVVELKGAAGALADRCIGAHRGLYRVSGFVRSRRAGPKHPASTRVLVHELLGGGRFRVMGRASALTEGDLFDGRLVFVPAGFASEKPDPSQADTSGPYFLPGRIYYPRHVHPLVGELVTRARERGLLRTPILDGLMRIRMRMHRFPGMQARHLFSLDALLDREIMSAGWARRSPPSQV